MRVKKKLFVLFLALTLIFSTLSVSALESVQEVPTSTVEETDSAAETVNTVEDEVVGVTEDGDSDIDEAIVGDSTGDQTGVEDSVLGDDESDSSSGDIESSEGDEEDTTETEDGTTEDVEDTEGSDGVADDPEVPEGAVAEVPSGDTEVLGDIVGILPFAVSGGDLDGIIQNPYSGKLFYALGFYKNDSGSFVQYQYGTESGYVYMLRQNGLKYVLYDGSSIYTFANGVNKRYGSAETATENAEADVYAANKQNDTNIQTAVGATQAIPERGIMFVDGEQSGKYLLVFSANATGEVRGDTEVPNGLLGVVDLGNASSYVSEDVVEGKLQYAQITYGIDFTGTSTDASGSVNGVKMNLHWTTTPSKTLLIDGSTLDTPMLVKSAEVTWTQDGRTKRYNAFNGSSATGNIDFSFKTSVNGVYTCTLVTNLGTYTDTVTVSGLPNETASSAEGEKPVVSITGQPESATIGDTVTLTITTNMPSNVRFNGQSLNNGRSDYGTSFTYTATRNGTFKYVVVSESGQKTEGTYAVTCFTKRTIVEVIDDAIAGFIPSDLSLLAQTGMDAVGKLLWALVFIVAGIALAGYAFYKKSGKKIISLILCAALTISSIGIVGTYSVFADRSGGEGGSGYKGKNGDAYSVGGIDDRGGQDVPYYFRTCVLYEGDDLTNAATFTVNGDTVSPKAPITKAYIDANVPHTNWTYFKLDGSSRYSFSSNGYVYDAIADNYERANIGGLDTWSNVSSAITGAGFNVSGMPHLDLAITGDASAMENLISRWGGMQGGSYSPERCVIYIETVAGFKSQDDGTVFIAGSQDLLASGVTGTKGDHNYVDKTPVGTGCLLMQNSRDNAGIQILYYNMLVGLFQTNLETFGNLDGAYPDDIMRQGYAIFGLNEGVVGGSKLSANILLTAQPSGTGYTVNAPIVSYAVGDSIAPKFEDYQNLNVYTGSWTTSSSKTQYLGIGGTDLTGYSLAYAGDVSVAVDSAVPISEFKSMIDAASVNGVEVIIGSKTPAQAGYSGMVGFGNANIVTGLKVDGTSRNDKYAAKLYVQNKVLKTGWATRSNIPYDNARMASDGLYSHSVAESANWMLGTAASGMSEVNSISEDRNTVQSSKDIGIGVEVALKAAPVTSHLIIYQVNGDNVVVSTQDYNYDTSTFEVVDLPNNADAYVVAPNTPDGGWGSRGSIADDLKGVTDPNDAITKIKGHTQDEEAESTSVPNQVVVGSKDNDGFTIHVVLLEDAETYGLIELEDYLLNKYIDNVVVDSADRLGDSVRYKTAKYNTSSDKHLRTITSLGLLECPEVHDSIEDSGLNRKYHSPYTTDHTYSYGITVKDISDTGVTIGWDNASSGVYLLRNSSGWQQARSSLRTGASYDSNGANAGKLMDYAFNFVRSSVGDIRTISGIAYASAPANTSFLKLDGVNIKPQTIVGASAVRNSDAVVNAVDGYPTEEILKFTSVYTSTGTTSGNQARAESNTLSDGTDNKLYHIKTPAVEPEYDYKKPDDMSQEDWDAMTEEEQHQEEYKYEKVAGSPAVKCSGHTKYNMTGSSSVRGIAFEHLSVTSDVLTVTHHIEKVAHKYVTAPITTQADNSFFKADITSATMAQDGVVSYSYAFKKEHNGSNGTSTALLHFYPEVIMAWRYINNGLYSNNPAYTDLYTMGEERRNAYARSLYLYRIESVDDTIINPVSGVVYSDSMQTGSGVLGGLSNKVVIPAGSDVTLMVDMNNVSLNLYGYSLDLIDRSEDSVMNVSASETVGYADIVKSDVDVYSGWVNSGSHDALEHDFEEWVNAMTNVEYYGADVQLYVNQGYNSKWYYDFGATIGDIQKGTIVTEGTYPLEFRHGALVENNYARALFEQIAEDYGCSETDAKALFLSSDIYGSILKHIESSNSSFNTSKTATFANGVMGGTHWYDEVVRTFVVRRFACENNKFTGIILEDKVDFGNAANAVTSSARGLGNSTITSEVLQNTGRWYLSLYVAQSPSGGTINGLYATYDPSDISTWEAARMDYSALLTNVYVNGADFTIPNTTTGNFGDED